jgi:hypothetical protein
MLPIFQRTVTNSSGDVLPGASVEVRRESDNALVQLYADRAGTVLLPNPTTADGDGFVQFFAASSNYKITATSGAGTVVWRYVDIGSADVRSDLSAPTGAAMVGADDGAGGSLWTTAAGFIARIVSGAGSSVVGFLQNGAGAMARTVDDELSETLKLTQFSGADPTGSTDSTPALISAVNEAVASGKSLEIPSGCTFLVATFGSTLSDGIPCAVEITGSIRVVGSGTIASATSGVTNTIFGIDASAGAADVVFDGVKFAGDARYRAIHQSADSSLRTLTIKNVTTDRQSVVIIGEVRKALDVSNNRIGVAIDSTTAVSPTLTVTLPENPTYTPSFKVSGNTVYGGTENLSSGAFVIHGIPLGGTLSGNTHVNLGGSATEGFDIDNVGRFARILGNTAIGSSFEYKTGTRGFSDSRDVIFAHNVSIGGDAGFSIRSSCIGYGNIAYNPKAYGLYCTPGADVDGLLSAASMQLSGFKIIYSGGTPWTAAVKVDGGMAAMEFDDFSIELDPAWASANPAGTLPGIQFNVDGGVNNLTIRDTFIDKSAGDQINVRPSTRAANMNFENIRFGDCGDSCIDLLNCDAVRIVNPVFPASITDRPVRLSTCDRVRIECDYHASITLAQTSGTNTGVLINNWGQEAAGAATPPNASSRWPVGCMVTNTSDGSVWLRVNVSTTPASAWKQIA